AVAPPSSSAAASNTLLTASSTSSNSRPLSSNTSAILPAASICSRIWPARSAVSLLASRTAPRASESANSKELFTAPRKSDAQVSRDVVGALMRRLAFAWRWTRRQEPLRRAGDQQREGGDWDLVRELQGIGVVRRR